MSRTILQSALCFDGGLCQKLLARQDFTQSDIGRILVCPETAGCVMKKARSFSGASAAREVFCQYNNF